MGYDLHITRKKYYFDENGELILESEWKQYVASDPELKFFPENGPLFVHWKGNSDHPEPWFDWYEGDITTKNPDPPVIEKMLTIAKALNAKVQGDDGEIYRSPTDTYHEEEDTAPASETVNPTKTSWWKKLFGKL